ncbi:MAG TPA: NRDE family protein [Flavihumibacter sp.]|nr:NRDE family protein [Bacteroidota bacterium]HPZ87645.1 NRDE family protein [Flavihumibacter sp.]HQD09318.1 NRDE family protein [Flavihumibacter sp.]
MCTVIFHRSGNEILIASNRDEQIDRPAAVPPSVHQVHGRKMLFPQDAKAGGTWIVADEAGGVAVLFNGAFTKHVPEKNYRLSRGLVLIDLLGPGSFQDNFNGYTLAGIEPFSVVYFQQPGLWLFRWDGLQKHSEVLDTHQSYLWASATLYDEEQWATKMQRFEQWKRLQTKPTAEGLLRFQMEQQTLENRLPLKTVSSTSIALSTEKINMLYADHRLAELSTTALSIKPQLIHCQ